MNQKTKQLATQAGLKLEDLSDDVFIPLEKFAELLAQECIKIVENEAAQYSEPVWALELVNDIAEQFGVKHE